MPIKKSGNLLKAPCNTALIMLYKTTKAMIHSPDGDTHFFIHCLRCFARKYISTIYMFIIYLDYNGIE